MVRDAECSPERLDAVVTELLRTPDMLEHMQASARGLGRPDAAQRVADLAEEHARVR